MTEEITTTEAGGGTTAGLVGPGLSGAAVRTIIATRTVALQDQDGIPRRVVKGKPVPASVLVAYLERFGDPDLEAQKDGEQDAVFARLEGELERAKADLVTEREGKAVAEKRADDLAAQCDEVIALGKEAAAQTDQALADVARLEGELADVTAPALEPAGEKPADQKPAGGKPKTS